MTDRRGFDTLTPDFRLSINGAELPQAARADMVSVRVLSDVGAAGMFAFTLSCWDGQRMQVKWIDDDLFQEGGTVEIRMGYRDRLEKVMEGDITGLEPEFPQGEPPRLTVRGYDRRHRLMGRRKTRTFLKMKDSDIASQIAGDWSLQPDVEDTRVNLEYVLQHNQTDFEFLQERARRIGFEMVVSERSLRFGRRRNEGSAVLTLNREVELLEFNVRSTTMGQLGEVLVQGWDPKAKEEVVARAGIGDERPMGGSASGPAAARRAFGGMGAARVSLPLLSREEADQLAGGWFGEMALNHVEGEGLCIGRPELRPGALIELQGLGRRFSGVYYVISTEHSFTPAAGYRTAFTVRRNAT
jgi:phage protein D